MKRLAACLIISIAFIITACSPSETGQVEPMSRTEFLMGTTVSVKTFDGDMEKAMDAVFEHLRLLSGQISVNDQETVSLIDKINEQAGKEPVHVPEHIFYLIKTGKEYGALSEGAFDITIGPLTGLWRIGFPDARKPADSEIKEVLPLIDYQLLTLDEAEQTVYLEKPGMQLDLGAIAKGFMTDEVVKILHEHDVTSAIIDLGGNIFVLGKNTSGKPWSVGVQDPFAPRGQIVGKLEATNQSIVTSGIYERNLVIDDKLYHHILNPKDGYPFDNEIAGVSVITDRSIDGDALSTILFAKGLQEGLQFAEKMENVEAIFITKDRKVYITSGLKDNFELVSEDYELIRE